MKGDLSTLKLATQLLEDKSILLQLQLNDVDKLIAPNAHLISVFAVQPSRDIQDAVNKLSNVAKQPGVEIIRQIFLTELKSKIQQKSSPYTCLLLLVRVSYTFKVRSKHSFPFILREAQKAFLRRRSITFTILEASGCDIALISGNKLIQVHLFREKYIPEGLSIFKGKQEFHSNLLQPFL